MSERWLSTVMGKAGMPCFYGAFLCYFSFVILPRVLPNFEAKRQFKKEDCPLAWHHPNSSAEGDTCYVYPQNLMEIKLPKFLSNYKNPCWMEHKSNGYNVPIRCLPYFFLVGAPKCGTTDLNTRLLKHPQVSDRVKKEIHWFTRKRFVAVKPFFEQLPMFDNYTYQMRLAAEDAYFTVDENGYHKKVVGDSSVSTLWDSSFAIRFEHATGNVWPMYTVAQNIHHLNPNTKFISIIRDPVERVYSDYLYFAHGKINTKDHFHYAVQRVIELTESCLSDDSIRKCVETWSVTEERVIELTETYLSDDSIRKCMDTWSVTEEVRILVGLHYIYFKEFYDVFPADQILVMKLEDFSSNISYYMNNVRILVGLYYIYFKEFYDVFPAEQILVMKLEDFSSNISYYMNSVFQHLELDPVSEELMAEISENSNANTRRKEDIKLGGMYSETRKLLQDFYRPYNEKLGQLLGQEFNYNTIWDQAEEEEHYMSNVSSSSASPL